jgi:hypothetical protein
LGVVATDRLEAKNSTPGAITSLFVIEPTPSSAAMLAARRADRNPTWRACRLCLRVGWREAIGVGYGRSLPRHPKAISTPS